MSRKAIEPDLPPSGRFIRQRVMERGNPHASKIITFRVGTRRDRRDYEPTRCRARRRGTDEQCGRLPVQGYRVCPIHGAGYRLRQRNGDRLPPEVSGALGTLVRWRKRGNGDLGSMRLFPEIAEMADRCRADPTLVDLQRDAVLLSAFCEALFAGTVRVADPMTFAGVVTRIIGTKMKVLRTKAAIEKPNTIAADRGQRIIKGLVHLLVQYVPQGLQDEVAREVRLIEIREESDEPRRTRKAK